MIEKAELLLSDKVEEIPLELEENPSKIDESNIKPEVLPTQDPPKAPEDKPEVVTFNQSPKAVREYQLFENFEDPEFYNDNANFEKIIEDLNK